jgi:hypothetical protein
VILAESPAQTLAGACHSATVTLLTGQTARGRQARGPWGPLKLKRSVSDTGLLASVAANVTPGNHHNWHIRQKPSASGRMQYVERIHKDNRLETTVAKCRLQLCKDTGDLIDFRTRKLYRVARGLRRIGIVVLAITARRGLVCDEVTVSLWFLAPGLYGRNL